MSDLMLSIPSVIDTLPAGTCGIRIVVTTTGRATWCLSSGGDEAKALFRAFLFYDARGVWMPRLTQLSES
jgi:hypothetical protein